MARSPGFWFKSAGLGLSVRPHFLALLYARPAAVHGIGEKFLVDDRDLLGSVGRCIAGLEAEPYCWDHPGAIVRGFLALEWHGSERRQRLDHS